MKTQAAIAHTADGGFDLCEVDLAAPSRGEVRVRMQACGICRSDLSALEGKETVEFPVVLGHEGAGIVEAVGDGVGSVKEGDAVILSWTPACGTCPGCLRGEVQLCEAVNMTTGSRGPLTLNGRALDRFMALGAFCEHVVVPQAMAVPVHTGLDPAHTCLIGCGVTTGFGAAVNTAAVRWGETVAVFGCGGVGLAAIQGARIATGAKAKFNGLKNTITLTGNPTINQGKSRVSGSRIILFINEDRGVVEGGSQRVKVVIFPEELKK